MCSWCVLGQNTFKIFLSLEHRGHVSLNSEPAITGAAVLAECDQRSETRSIDIMTPWHRSHRYELPRSTNPEYDA